MSKNIKPLDRSDRGWQQVGDVSKRLLEPTAVSGAGGQSWYIDQYGSIVMDARWFQHVMRQAQMAELADIFRLIGEGIERHLQRYPQDR